MCKNITQSTCYFLITLTIIIVAATTGRATTVTSFTQNSTSISRLDKYEATFTMSKTWTNPYDYLGQVEVDAFVTPPSGPAVTVPGFWFVDYTRSLTDTIENLTATGTTAWKIRYAPTVTGTFTYYLRIIDRTTGDTIRYPSTGTESFSCVSGSEKGFLKVNTTDKAYLQYEDGSLYVGIGHNLVGWEYDGTTNSRGTYDYDTWLDSLSGNNGNLTQFDFCEGDQLEWTYNATELPYSSSWAGIGTYNQQTAWKMDYRVNKATSDNVFYRLAMSHWEDFDYETGNFPSWGWNRNPYNSANGGPNADVSTFFTNSTSIAYYKRYLRYIVARWGYSKNLLAYELWNEVDGSMDWGSSSYGSNQTNITNWHDTMALFVKNLDTRHIVTTSFANSGLQNSVWALPALDLTTVHRYTYYNADYGGTQYETENTIGSLIQTRFVSYPKPVIIGEFALSPAGDIQRNYDPSGIAFHNQLWASIMNRGAATAMHWTWGSYINNYHLYYHYKPLGIFLNGEDLTNMQLFTSYNATARSYGLRTWWKAYIWVQDLNHTFINRANTQDSISGQVVNLSVMDSGSYSVKFYNTYTGAVISTTTLTCPSTGYLHISVPKFLHDIAIKVSKISGPVGNTNYAAGPGFEGETANQTPSGWSTWPGAAGTDYDADYSEALTPHTGTNRGTQYKASAFEVYTFQIITGIPNGTYTYKAWVISSGGQSSTFIEAKDYGSTPLLQTNIPTTGTWTQIEVDNIPVTNGQCTIGIYSKGAAGNWNGFDDITFTKNSGGGSAATDSVHTRSSPVPIDIRPAVVIYPNPANDELLIQGIVGSATVQVYSIKGDKVMEKVVSGQPLYIGQLSPGVYVLKINNQTMKFIKK